VKLVGFYFNHLALQKDNATEDSNLHNGVAVSIQISAMHILYPKNDRQLGREMSLSRWPANPGEEDGQNCE
jgi:hypothetical protein